MCGIAGFVGKGNIHDLDVITDSLAHRGPDERGTWVDSENAVYLGHRRLSIIDLLTGQQPMLSADESLVIVFNGEIYNHADLRAVLEKKGRVFKTHHSDTETLLNAYLEWGPDFVSRLNGMWSFVIYDRKKKLLFCSRDRFGEKPFFYTVQGDTFVFGSELTALRKFPHISLKVSKLSLQKYFAYGYIPSPNSIYENVHKLPGGCSLTYDLTTRSASVQRYWSYVIEPFETMPRDPEKQFAEEFQYLFDKAVQRRLISDVPLGVFLSGGVDSSAITAYASRHMEPGSLKAFSIGFDVASFDETQYARRVASYFGCEHHIDVLSLSRALEIFPKLLERLDEPIADASLTPTYLLSEFTKKYVTVALSGDGGDELFSGYDPFQAIPFSILYNKLVPKSLHPYILREASKIPISLKYMSFDLKIKRALRGMSYDKRYWLPVWMSPLSVSEMSELFDEPLSVETLYSEALEQWENCKQTNMVDKMTQYFVNIYFQDDILVKSDRASMMNGLEVRAPFLDIDLVDFVRRIPHNYRYKFGKRKYIMKKALQHVLPAEVLHRKKKGFGAPVGDWFQQQSIKIDLSGTNYFNKSFVSQKIDDHINKRTNDSAFLWTLYSLNSKNL